MQPDKVYGNSMFGKIKIHDINQHQSSHLMQSSKIHPIHPNNKSIPVIIKASRDDRSRVASTCDEMRSEQMYDWATWRMYYRITNARRKRSFNDDEQGTPMKKQFESSFHREQPLSNEMYKCSRDFPSHFTEEYSGCIYYDVYDQASSMDNSPIDEIDPEETFVFDMEV